MRTKSQKLTQIFYSSPSGFGFKCQALTKFCKDEKEEIDLRGSSGKNKAGGREFGSRKENNTTPAKMYSGSEKPQKHQSQPVYCSCTLVLHFFTAVGTLLKINTDRPKACRFGHCQIFISSLTDVF